MAQNYEDIVRKWYERLRIPFLNKLINKYPGMTLYDADDLYQDAFLAIYDNIQKDSLRYNPDKFASYIITIGMNLASKRWRKMGKTDSFDKGFDTDDEEQSKPSDSLDLEKIINKLPNGEGLYNNSELQSLLGNELAHTPDPCATIIGLYYGLDNDHGLSMKEIALRMGLKNADTAKAKKSQCMTDLINRVSDAVAKAGFNLKPKKRNSNGKN